MVQYIRRVWAIKINADERRFIIMQQVRNPSGSALIRSLARQGSAEAAMWNALVIVAIQDKTGNVEVAFREGRNAIDDAFESGLHSLEP